MRLMWDTLLEANSNQVSGLRNENEQLTVLVAEPSQWRGNLALMNRVLQKRSEWYGLRLARYMRISPAEKMEIIRSVEPSDLSVDEERGETATLL